jgi:cation diffusion facilitator CzcD-associated flavoprotein CzcO
VTEHHDAIIIGAGLTGIYQLYKLRELGMDVTVLEAADGLGGTWYHNRYPGCRFDSESYSYGYSFSQELLDEWHWTEHFSPQPETLRYFEHVADRFDLRRHMQFGCRVTSAVWNEDDRTWTVRLDDGRELSCRWLITAIGVLSTPQLPRIDGIERFTGPWFHTYDWPHDGIDLRGKRVAVVGTGATGVQIIGAIASEAEELVVFQRHPNWCAPLHNAPIDEAEMAEIRKRYDEVFELCRRSLGSFIHIADRRKALEVPADGRATSVTCSSTRRPTPTSPRSWPRRSAGGSTTRRSPRS